MSEQEVRHLMRIVRWHLSDFRDHCDFEDLCAEAHLAFWRVLRDYQGPYSPETIARLQARSAAVKYLRSSRGRRNGLTEIDSAACATVCLHDKAWSPVTPDIAPAVIARLEAEALWEDVWENATPKQRRIVRSYFQAGMTPREIEIAFGMAPSTLYVTIRRMANAYHWRHGLPPLPLRPRGRPKAGGTDPEKKRATCRRYYYRKKEREKEVDLHG